MKQNDDDGTVTLKVEYVGCLVWPRVASLLVLLKAVLKVGAWAVFLLWGFLKRELGNCPGDPPSLSGLLHSRVDYCSPPGTASNEKLPCDWFSLALG